MNKKFVDRVYEIADIASVKLRFLSPILKPVYHALFVNRINKKKNRVFNENAINVLTSFDECMKEYNHPYTLAFGTLLGAIREKGFIKHDLDIDTNMWSDDYSPSISEHLSKKGFKLKYLYLVEDGKFGREETYEKDGVSIDIFYLYPPVDEYPYCNDFYALPQYGGIETSMKKEGRIKTRRLELPIARERTYTPFEGLQLPVPINAKDVLEFRYGSDYMIPNPKWSGSAHYNNPHIVEWPEKKAVYINLEYV